MPPRVTSRHTSDPPRGVLRGKGKDKKGVASIVEVSCGWPDEIGEILTILIRGTADGRIPARPVVRYIVQAAKNDKIFMAAVARRDQQAAANRLYKIGREIIRGGVKPVNADSTAKRKGGDRRALRNDKGQDRVYEEFTTDPPPK